MKWCKTKKTRSEFGEMDIYKETNSTERVFRPNKNKNIIDHARKFKIPEEEQTNNVTCVDFMKKFTFDI